MSKEARKISCSNNIVVQYSSTATEAEIEYATESTALLSPQSKKKDSTIISVISIDEDKSFNSRNFDFENNDNGTEHNVFANPDVAAYYRKVYENAEYEGRHVFDPEMTWSKDEERRVLWKIEWNVLLWACIMFMALNMDRGNISQALSDNMLNDLGLTTNDYNLGQTIFYVSFLSAELPSQLVSKKLGPDRWVPIQITLWSLVATYQSQLTGRTSFFITRTLLGILEGGFIADVVLWLSYFYTGKELPVRLSLFWTSGNLTHVLTSLLAFGLLHMNGIKGWEGWRWMFFIEGLFTLFIGIVSFFMMPASPVQTKTWFRPKGWFTDREERIVVNRVLREDPSKGDMNNREAISLQMILNSIVDYDLWPLYIIGIIAFVPTGTASAYFTLILRSLGFSQFNTNLLTIPKDIIHTILLLGVSWISEYFDERSLVIMIQPLWLIPCTAMLTWWNDSVDDIWGTYTLLVVLLSAPYIHAILVSWCSRNSNAVGSRTLSAAIYNMFVQGGSIISANIYRKDDYPKYYRGNKTLFILSWVSLLMILFSKFYYLWRNHTRDKIWNSMSEEERNEYRTTTMDKGNKRLDFRFGH